MKNKIISQMLDSLRATGLAPSESFELSLQILVWAKLSVGQSIPASLRLDASLMNDPGRVFEAMGKLEQGDGLLHLAFSGGKQFSRLDPAQLLTALDLALRLRETGVLQSFDPADIITVLSSWSSGEMGRPPEVASLMASLAGICAGDTVYTPWDFGGQLSARAAKLSDAVYLETPQHGAIPALISLLAEKQFQVNCSDPIRFPSAVEGGKPRQFDVALAFPPIGLRYGLDVVDSDWFGRFPERTSSGAVLTVRHLLSQTRRRVVVAVSNGLLFSVGAELALRQDLLKRGMVQAVVALPSGLLDSSNIPFAILVLDPAGGHEQVAFINADSVRYREPISKAKARLVNSDDLIKLILEPNVSEDSAIVFVADVLANNAQLQVDRYVLPNAKKQLQGQLANATTVALGDVITTIRPMATTTNEECIIEAQEIGAADLPPFGYISTPGRIVKIDQQSASKNGLQFLRPLDIVIIVKGSVGKVGIVPTTVPPPGPGGWVAGQSAIVLRPVSGAAIDPRALMLQLRSPLGQALLRGIVSGASIQLIQLKELSRLQVLIPDLATARRVATAIEQEAQLQIEIDRLRQEQSKIAADIWTLG